MIKNRFLLVVAFAMFIMIPFSINAETGKNFNVEVKNLEDYLCEGVKGHTLGVSIITRSQIVVNDETNDKQYLIDFSNIGSCVEYTDQKLEDDYIPTTYTWEGNKLYLETYSNDYLFVNSKTLDKEIDSNSGYSELKTDGFYHVENPTVENLQNYYEGYFFQLATGEYDIDETYYEIKLYQYNTENYNGDYELAIQADIDENTYEVNKYYIIAKPVKKEFLAQFNSDTFIVPKDKTTLNSDLSLTKSNFNSHFEFGNKKYFVFSNLGQQNRYLAIFDENSNYQTFGLDNLMSIHMFLSEDNKYLSFLTEIDNKNHVILLDKSLDKLVLYDVSDYGDDFMFVGYKGNKFYYSFYDNGDKILEIDYLRVLDEYKVTFDANGGKFGNEIIYTIDNWNANLYDNLTKPTRVGYTFKGYYTEKTGGTKFEMILNESGIDSNMTFYAQWELEQEVPKTLDNITSSILMGAISLVGLVGATIYLKKKNKVRA